jgi:protease I
MARVLIPLPRRDFDPTEAAVPWQALARLGHELIFATPDGQPAQADARMLNGRGLGPWRALLRADARGRAAHAAMVEAPEFRQPRRHFQLSAADFDALILPGGHAKGMREYLESRLLQALVAQAFADDKPVGAICHGVVLAARSRRPDGRSVLQGRRTTALTRALELSGWALTALWLGGYYRTYPQTVQGEVTAALADPRDFEAGPMALRRDDPTHLERGFTVRDGNYLSARWPGDVHRFAAEFADLLSARAGLPGT